MLCHSHPDICFPLQQYGSHCSSMVPTAAVWFPLQQYGSHCSSMVPIAAVWFPLQQYGSHCSSMVPIAAVWFPLQQYGSHCSSMVPIAAVWFPLQQYGSHCSSMVPRAAVWLAIAAKSQRTFFDTSPPPLSTQCLSNTEPLRSYFLATDPTTGGKLYTGVLNINNPLGSGGAIAQAFSKLMEEMWRGGKTSVAPRLLKVHLTSRWEGEGCWCRWSGEEDCFGGGGGGRRVEARTVREGYLCGTSLHIRDSL